MEAWQTEILATRGPDLIKLITCDSNLFVSLLSQRILSSEDIERLTTILHREGNTATSFQLLQLLPSRVKGYEALCQALRDLGQTGAVQILEEGVLHNTPAYKEAQLQQRRIQDCNLTIPESLAYYIPRVLICRRQLSKVRLFQINDAKDIFVFRGMELNEMARFRSDFDKSSNELQRKVLKHHFILLDSDGHFDKICNKSGVSSVHLINYKEGKFFWVKTHGRLAAIYGVLDADQDRLTEGQFVEFCLSPEEIKDKRPVCISDTPGMGKTILLASVASKLAEMQGSDSFVIFLVLRDFMELLHHEEIQSDRRREDSIEKNLCGAISKTLFKASNSTNFEGFEANKNYNLMLDGFDEILRLHQTLSGEMLKYLATLPNVRIWITTRPHLLHELETRFCVLGFNILPFQGDDQLAFLHRFWEGKGAVVNDKLKFYAESRLQELNKQMSDTDRDIAGIPLQCLMLAQVFEDDALDYCRTSVNYVISPVASFIAMYAQFVEKQFSKFRRKCEDESELVVTEVLTEVHTYLAVELLFPELLCEFEASFQYERNIEICDSGIVERRSPQDTPKFIHRTFAEYFFAKKVLQMLLQSSLPNNGGENNTVLDKLFKILVVMFEAKKSWFQYYNLDDMPGSVETFKFKHPTLCYFLNNLCKQISVEETTFLSTLVAPMEYHIHIREWFPAAVEANLLELIKLADTMFPGSVKKLYLHDKLEVHYALIRCSVGTKSVDVLDYVCEWVQRWGATSLRNLQPNRGREAWQLQFLEYFDDFREGNEIPNEYSLTGYAARLGFFLLFKYLFDKFKLDHWISFDVWGATVLLRCVVQHTRLESDDIIEEKKEMIKVILGVNRHKKFLEGLQQEWDELLVDLHSQLAICLLQEAWKVEPTAVIGPGVLHLTLESYTVDDRKMKAQDFHQLITMLIERGFTFKDLNALRLRWKGNVLHVVLIGVEEVMDSTLQLFSDIGADFKCVDKRGYSILKVAKLHCSERVVKKLVTLGATEKYSRFDRLKSYFRKLK